MSEAVFSNDAIGVLELNRRISAAVSLSPDIRNVWVVAETSDVRSSSGHCYLELVEKAADGSNLSRIRGTIWASTFRQLSEKFMAVTGSPFTSAIKVRVLVTASYHPTYGMAVNITDIDPVYTMGDALRRRAEIVERLTREGLIELNRRVAWPLAPMRIAVISAQGAAGYGDFINQLFTNPSSLRFSVELFNAVMQGDRTVPTVIDALSDVISRRDEFDAIVIIRGGGSTTDLAAFDSYELAACVARSPLPVIIGIGHERDITVLDYVANMRVKTPTAAAEWLVARATKLLDALGRATDRIYQATVERIGADREFLARAAAQLPGLTSSAILRQHSALQRHAFTLVSLSSATVGEHRQRLSRCADNIALSANRAVERASDRLDRIKSLVDALSPEAVLARGFSLTFLPDGRVLRNIADASPGTTLTTKLDNGSVTSTVDNP